MVGGRPERGSIIKKNWIMIPLPGGVAIRGIGLLRLPEQVHVQVKKKDRKDSVCLECPVRLDGAQGGLGSGVRGVRAQRKRVEVRRGAWSRTPCARTDYHKNFTILTHSYN